MQDYITAAVCIIGMLICVAYIGRQIYMQYLETKSKRIEEINRRIEKNVTKTQSENKKSIRPKKIYK